jgi:hypothetical protein
MVFPEKGSGCGQQSVAIGQLLGNRGQSLGKNWVCLFTDGRWDKKGLSKIQ